MITLIAAAVLAAQAPVASAPADPMAQHAQHQQGHEGMDCCKECCKHMAGKHEGHDAEHGGHAAE